MGIGEKERENGKNGEPGKRGGPGRRGGPGERGGPGGRKWKNWGKGKGKWKKWRKKKWGIKRKWRKWKRHHWFNGNWNKDDWLKHGHRDADYKKMDVAGFKEKAKSSLEEILATKREKLKEICSRNPNARPACKDEQILVNRVTKKFWWRFVWALKMIPRKSRWILKMARSHCSYNPEKLACTDPD